MRLRVRPVVMVCLSALASSCTSASDPPAVGSISSALNAAAWVVPPVLQQTHTVGAASDFSVLYVAAGGSCGVTTTPCVATSHTLNFSVHGSSVWSAVTLQPYPQGNGYVVSDPHMGDNTIDCQWPDSAGSCGTSTTYWDVGPYGPHQSLEAAFPPWKVIKATGLQPDTLYDWFVRIDGDGSNFDTTTSATGQIHTPPVHSASAPGFKFVFNSDPQGDTPGDTSDNAGSGHLDNQRRDNVLSAIGTFSHPAFMLNGGDLGLNGGGPKLGAHWLNDKSSGTPSIPTQVLSTIPFFPAFGNHDWMSAGSLDFIDCCNQSAVVPPVARHWDYTPTAAMVYGYTTGGLSSLATLAYTQQGAKSYTPYYSFNWGNSHFLILSTGPDNTDGGLAGTPYKDTANVGIDSTQFAFAAADLAAAAADPDTRHIFVALHDPIFHSYGDSTYPVNYVAHTDNTSPPPACGPYDTCPNSPGQLTALFRKFHVDMVLGGHIHTYSRIQDQGVWYVTAGIAAGPIDQVETYPGNSTQNLAHNGCESSAVPSGTASSIPCVKFNDDGGPSHSPGFAKQTWGYVEITVADDNVTYSAKQVIAGTADGSNTNPPPTPTEFDAFSWGVAPAVNLSLGLHAPSSGAGGIDIKYNVNSSQSGVTKLFTSPTGKPTSFTYQSGYDKPYTANSGSTQYTISYPSVTPGQTIYVQLQDVNGALTSPMSQTASIVVPACAMPPVTVTNTATGNLLTWPNTYSCNGVTLLSYSVYRMDDSGWNGIGTAIGSDSFLDPSWNCNASAVDYKVVAWTSAPGNQLVFSIPAYATATSLPWDQLCAPTSLTVTQLGQGKVQLNWNDAGQAWDSILVQRGAGISCNGTVPLATIAGSATSYVDTTAQADVLYCYTVMGAKGDSYYFSNSAKYHTWKSFAPINIKAQSIAANQVALTWGYPAGSAAVSTTIYRSTQPRDATLWEPIVTLANTSVNGAIVGQWVDERSSAREAFNLWQYQSNSDITYYYKAVGHSFTPAADSDQSFAPDTTHYQTVLTDNVSTESAMVSVTPKSSDGCASGMPDTVFTPGVEACPGSVSYPNAASLCAPGYALCTAAQWDATFRADGNTPPANNYWLADNLGYAGSGANNCSVSGTAGNCGSNDPMRVCGSTSDAQGNACNWTGCGYTSSSVNGTGSEYFGGCAGNLTAGALCCIADSTACSSLASAEQAFAPGVVGCAGKVTWDRRQDLCGAGCTACSASQYMQYSSGTPPRYDYWTNDNLGFAGSASACGAYSSGGTSCGTNDPMRLCVPRTTTDPLGNVCNWHDCGFNGVPPVSSGDDYFGGCSGNTTAGTLCCCDQ
jgi:hypothetical protein